MNIIRRSILIGCEGNGQNFLSQVKVDIDNYYSFLLSPEGGFWYKNEIIMLMNPTLFEINSAIQSVGGVGYAFVVYGGHGFYDGRTGEQFLELGREGIVPASILSTNATRQLIIIDACRVIRGLPFIKKAQKEGTLGGYQMPTNYALSCRGLFDQYLNSIIPQTQAWIYSCIVGESAIDGLFSPLLLNQGRALAYQFSNNSSASNIFDVQSVFFPAAQQTATLALSMSNNSQNPEIFRFNYGLQLPFSVG